MKALILIAIAAFLAAATAAPMEVPTESFNEECGAQNNLTKAEYDKFSIMDDEFPENVKCYFSCDLEKSGVFFNGTFSQLFLEVVSEKLEKQVEDAPALAIHKGCAEAVTSDDSCEAAAEYMKCVSASSMLMGLFMAVAENLSEGLSENSNFSMNAL